MTARRKAAARMVIGWREWLAVPTLGIGRIKAKIDSGARTSAIHAYDIEPYRHRGADHVAFAVHPEQRRRHPEIACRAPVVDRRVVTSSNGHREERFVIAVEIVLGDLTVPIELTLADRDAMGFRMLLGREALRRRFLIDPGRSYVAGKIAIPTIRRAIR